MFLLSLFVCAAAPVALAVDSVVISEFMAAGQFVVTDEDGDYSDWLEIHNTGAAPLDLSGWHLTDKKNSPAKWTLPALSIPPDGYLLVFADGKDRANPGARLHADFALGADGEYLALTRPDGSIAFAFDPYPMQLPDVSYDNAGRFLGYPTPAAANDPRKVAMAAAPQFSESRGLKTRAFVLTLSAETVGALIRYTIDGSEPSETSGALYTAPIPISKTTVVRAVAFTESLAASAIATRSFIFPTDVAQQARDGKAPPRWPKKWPNHKTDYGMDRRISEVSPYREHLQRGLRAIPSISIVLPFGSLFDAETGIYVHPQERSKEWERPASVELINPDGTPGYQINAGIRIRGGASRDSSNPKHSLRLFFRRGYGAARLDYPMFGPEGTPSSDKFDLRCDQISSWHWAGEKKNDFIRDQWGRDTQLAMSQPGDRGDFYHLYINGLYWGLYNTQERHDASFAASYFGGDEDDYDVVKYDNTFGGTNDSDGTIASWRRLHDAAHAGFADTTAYQRVQGNNPDGSRNPAFERLVDVDNLIDYMLLGIYAAANDSPPSGGVQNNWGAIKSRKGDFGFRFFVHDWELSMFDPQADNIVGEQPTANPLDEVDYISSNPWHIWQALRFNADFRLRVADRVQMHFFGGGVLTPSKAAARFSARMAEINFAVAAESARWGDAFFTNNDGPGGPIGPFLTINPRLGKPAASGLELRIRGPENRRLLTRQDWISATHVAFLQNYFPVRTAVVLQQLKDGGLYPALEPPAITPGSGNIAQGQLVTIANPNAAGAVYYTTDGSDPRGPDAKIYAQPFLLGPLKRIKARVKDGETWSALIETRYENAQDFSKLRITEISYHNAAVGAVAGDEYDFIELKNDGGTALDLSGLLFDQGVTFAFPAGTTLAPGAFFLLGKNADRFAEVHPGKTLNGVFTGRLSDNGEDLALSAGSGVPLITLHYRPDEGWPAAANGHGFTIVRADKGNPDNPKNWRASANPGGSPGADDPEPPAFPHVVVQRLIGNPASGPDTVEIKNVGGVTTDISGWWLTDDPATPKKLRIVGIPIPAGLTLTVAAAALEFSRTGAGVWIFSANPAGNLTGYAHGFNYGALEPGLFFERRVNSAGEEKFVLSGIEPNPRLNEIHFHPAIGGDEFVELRSDSPVPFALDGWRLAGLSFTFPSGAAISGLGFALVVTTDPAAFRAKYNVPAAVPIFGPATGNLQDDGEVIVLQKPLTFAGVAGTFFETWESVRYNDKAPWPYETNGFGASLQRPAFAHFADDPANWIASAPTPGIANSVNAAPTIVLTSPLNGARLLPPATIAFRADATDDDGSIVKVEFFSDSRVVGEDTSAPFAFDWTGVDAGRHDLTARATDDSGNVTETDAVTVFIENAEPGAGQGLAAEYFANEHLEGTPVARIDPTIAFQWTDIDPAPGISRTGFSVRWTGKYRPRATGESFLNVQCAGGVRLFVNDVALIDEWSNETQTTFVASFSSVAGLAVSFRVEYRDADGFANIQLTSNPPFSFQSMIIATESLYAPTRDPGAFGIATPLTLPAARVGVPYQLQFSAVHGVRLFAFREESPLANPPPGFTAGTPPGMNFSSSGLLTGTPTISGSYAIFISATDANNAAAPTELFFIKVLPAAPPPRPVVTVTAPIPRPNLIADAVRLAGSATSERGIQRVEYSLNGNHWRPMTLTAVPGAGSGTVTFITILEDLRGLIAGTNRLLVRAVDSDGTASRIVTTVLALRQFSELTVGVEGLGSVSPGFLGSTRREIGRAYTIVAAPARGQIFQGWKIDDFIVSSEPAYGFSMFRGLALKAAFIPNPFPALAGRYVAALGFDMDQNSARGALLVTLGRAGAFSARLRFDGKTYRFSGRLDTSGSYVMSLEGGGITERGGGGFESLFLQFTANFETGDIAVRLDRFRDEEFFTVEATLQRSTWTAARPCPLAGRWDVTVQAPPLPDVPGNPQPTTTGTARLDIDANGRAILTGALADGTTWTETNLVDDQLTLPLYHAIYNDLGSVSGDLRFTTDGGLNGSGDFFWSRPADETSTEFPLGFDVHVNVDAILHTEP